MINSLSIIQVSTLDVPTTVDLLVARSLICINEIYASIHQYSPTFDPKDPYSVNPEFKQLVAVVIKKGSKLLYKYIECIIEPISKLICPNCALGLQLHEITT